VEHRIVPERRYRGCSGRTLPCLLVVTGLWLSLKRYTLVIKRVANDAVKCWNPLAMMHDLQERVEFTGKEWSLDEGGE